MSTVFSQRFSALRHERGLSQRQAATDLGISQALLSHYENGLREPKMEFILKVCAYYGVSSDYLFGRSQIRRGIASYTEGFDQGETARLEHTFEIMSALGKIMKKSQNKAARAAMERYFELMMFKALMYLNAYPEEATGELGISKSSAIRLCTAMQLRYEAAMEEGLSGTATAEEISSRDTKQSLLEKLMPEIKRELELTTWALPEGGKNDRPE